LAALPILNSADGADASSSGTYATPLYHFRLCADDSITSMPASSNTFTSGALTFLLLLRYFRFNFVLARHILLSGAFKI